MTMQLISAPLFLFVTLSLDENNNENKKGGQYNILKSLINDQVARLALKMPNVSPSH
jgi:hypothetical protein